MYGAERSCFSGVIEFFVPPRPPAYTPTAVRLPEPSSSALCQIGVSLVRVGSSDALLAPPAQYPALRLRRAHEPRFVFRLAQHETAFCKYASLTRSEFLALLAELRAAFPAQLEAHYVVDVKQLWLFRVRRVLSETEQDLLHTLRQLVMIPEVLESAFFHRALALSPAEAMALVAIGERIRTAQRHAQQVHARVDEETKRMFQRAQQDDFEYAEIVFSKLLISSRYLCSDPIRQPLLIYAHEMLFQIASATFPHRVRAVTGPGGHVYFTLRRRRRRHRVWSLADTFSNDLAQLSEEGDAADDRDSPTSTARLSLLLDKPRHRRFTVRRAFPACRVHHRGLNYQLVPCITAVGDRQSKSLEIHSVPSSGAFASLGSIFAEPETATANANTLLTYRITARHDSGFTFFLGTYVRKTGQRVELLVHPGQDLIAMVMLAQLLDTFVGS